MIYDQILVHNLPDWPYYACYQKSIGEIMLLYKNWPTELKEQVEYYSAWFINHEAIHGVINDVGGPAVTKLFKIYHEVPFQAGIDLFEGKALMDIYPDLTGKYKDLHSIAFYRSWSSL